MKSGNLAVDEIVTATREVVKVVQRQAFPKEQVVLSRISDGTYLLLRLPKETICDLWDTLVLFGSLTQ